MTSYLIARGAWPIDAKTIRHALGLKTTALDLLITAGIASICSMSVRPVTSEVWDITLDEDPDRFGTPLSISAPPRNRLRPPPSAPGRVRRRRYRRGESARTGGALVSQPRRHRAGAAGGTSGAGGGCGVGGGGLRPSCSINGAPGALMVCLWSVD